MYIDIVIKNKVGQEYFFAILDAIPAEKTKDLGNLAKQFLKLSSFKRKGSKHFRYYCTIEIGGGKKAILKSTKLEIPSENKKALKALNELIDVTISSFGRHSGLISSTGFPLKKL